jgi:hypothetical protein
MSFPWAFALTMTSVLWIVRSYLRQRRALKKKAERWIPPVVLMTLAIGVVTFLPYCIVRNLRFIYFGKMLADLGTIALFILWLKVPRPRDRMLIPLLLAGAITTAFLVRNPSWLDGNAEDSRRYVEAVTRAYPDLKSCEPAHPCCITAPGRMWGRNEWVLSYNLGNASRTPAFYPSGWPDAHCEKFLKLN